MKILAFLSFGIAIFGLLTALPAVIEVFRIGSFANDLQVFGFFASIFCEIAALCLAIAAIIFALKKKHRNRGYSAPKLLLGLPVIVNALAFGMILTTLFMMIIAAGSVMK